MRYEHESQCAKIVSMTDPNQIIDMIGGTSEVARLCEVTTGAVSQWRSDGIPRARLMYLKAIRPDVFRSVVDKAGIAREKIPKLKETASRC